MHNLGIYRKFIYIVTLLTLIASLVQAPILAQSTAILKWTEVNKPGIRGFIIVNGSEINKIAVSSGDVIYALDSARNKVYKSTNGGLTWTDMTPNLIISGAPANFDDIAVAPDNSKIVAVVIGGTNVYASNDGGVSWNDTNVPPLLSPLLVNTTIQCIAISSYYMNMSNNEIRYDVAIGTVKWGDANSDGQLWIRTISSSSISAWTNQKITVDGNPDHGCEISSIAFSPNYNSDPIILAAASAETDVTSHQNSTVICIGKRDIGNQTTVWNNPGDFSAYPVPIAMEVDNKPPVISCLSLPSNFLGAPATIELLERRKIFVSYQRQPSSGNNDVYRIIDSISPTAVRLNANGGLSIDIASIAYYGTATDGKLIAGESTGTTTVQVRKTSNPLTTTSVPAWTTAIQPPTGPGNALVAWSNDGTVAYCGTGQQISVADDESAFSRSFDKGNTWEQVSLINTTIHISDVLPTPDSKGLFLASYNTFGTEGIWRSAGDPLGDYWGRILTMETSPSKVILRLSNDYENGRTVFAAEDNGSKLLLYVSFNGGNSWFKRAAPAPVIDIAIASEKTAYVALADGRIRKTVDGGMTWNAPVWTGVANINMMYIAKNGYLFIGSQDSKVSYSTDGGATFADIPEAISTVAGDVQVVADANYSKNNTIYAATNIDDHGVWRWVIGTSTAWEQIDRSLTDLGTDQKITGLAMGSEGTLYSLRGEKVAGTGITRSGGMNRTLNPTERYVTNIEWDVINTTLPDNTEFDPVAAVILPNTLPQLKISGNSEENDLWAADLKDNRIFVFADNICKTGPVTVNPEVIGCDPASGRGQEVNLAWEQLSLSNEHEIQVAKDSKFALMMADIGKGIDESNFYTPPSITSPAFIYWTDGGVAGSDNSTTLQPLECGHSYYWRTRTREAVTGEIIRSPWSTSKKFVIKAGFKVTTPYYGPQLLYPQSNSICPCNAPVSFSWSPFKETVAYRFELSENPDMSNPLVSTSIQASTAYRYEGTLKCNSTYFWRVMATQPAPSEWSAIFTLKTAETNIAASTPPAAEKTTPLWVWGIIALGSIIAGGLLILIIRR